MIKDGLWRSRWRTQVNWITWWTLSNMWNSVRKKMLSIEKLCRWCWGNCSVKSLITFPVKLGHNNKYLLVLSAFILQLNSVVLLSGILFNFFQRRPFASVCYSNVLGSWVCCFFFLMMKSLFVKQFEYKVHLQHVKWADSLVLFEYVYLYKYLWKSIVLTIKQESEAWWANCMPAFSLFSDFTNSSFC